MKSFISAIIIFATVFIGGAIMAKVYYINPGNVGVLIQKGGQSTKGVSDKPLQPGWGFRSLFTEDVVEYPTFLQTAVWTKSSTEGNVKTDDSITANSKEGVAINLDVSVSYTLDATKVPDLYVKYRSTIVNIQSTYLRQSVRQSVQDNFGNYSVEEIYGPKKQEIVANIQKQLVEGVGKDGFVFSQFTINEIRLPEQVMASINSKIQAGQDALKAEQQLKRIKIEADQKVAEAKGNSEARLANAKAEATAISLQSEAASNDKYVQLRKLEVERAAIDKWDGKLPSTFVPGSALPFLNLK